MESSDRKNVYLKAGDNSLNSGMRDTMIVGQGSMQPGKYPVDLQYRLRGDRDIVTTVLRFQNVKRV